MSVHRARCNVQGAGAPCTGTLHRAQCTLHCYSRRMSLVMVHPAVRVRGCVRPPGDKSISHRYALLAAIADGVSTIHGYSTGADCASTLRCLQGLGVRIEELGRDPVSGIDL